MGIVDGLALSSDNFDDYLPVPLNLLLPSIIAVFATCEVDDGLLAMGKT